MQLSTCCDAERYFNMESNICSACKEHADFAEENENLIKCDWCSNKTKNWIEIEGFEFCDETCEGNFYQDRNRKE